MGIAMGALVIYARLLVWFFPRWGRSFRLYHRSPKLNKVSSSTVSRRSDIEKAMANKGDSNGRPKRRLNDYAGLAALVAAVGAIVFGVTDRMSAREEADRMNRSLFEHAKSVGGATDMAKIAVLEWRVSQLERLLGHDHMIEVAPLPAPRPARTPASFDDGEEMLGELDNVIVDAGVAPPTIELEPEISFDQIQQTVEAGGVYEAEK